METPTETSQLDMSNSAPQLVVLAQGSVMQENFSKNGIAKQVHVVVKNLMFHVEVGSSVDLNKCSLEAKLYYDFDKEEDEKIEVAYVRNEPLEYKSAVSESGFKATVELRIKVLTSQHEDMLFRVHLSAVDPLTGQAFGCWTAPIKVISKLTQVNKKEKEATPSKKRTTTDVISTTLLEIQRQLDQQGKYIQMLVHKAFVDSRPNAQASGTEALHSLSHIMAGPTSLPIHPITDFDTELQEAEPAQTTVVQSEPKPDLETQFKNLIATLNSLHPEERQHKLDSLLASVPHDEVDQFLSLFDSSPAKKKQKISANSSRAQC